MSESQLRTVTKVAWEEIRVAFQQVWSHVVDRVDLSLSKPPVKGEIKIYRVGSIVRMDIKDSGPHEKWGE